MCHWEVCKLTMKESSQGLVAALPAENEKRGTLAECLEIISNWRSGQWPQNNRICVNESHPFAFCLAVTKNIICSDPV